MRGGTTLFLTNATLLKRLISRINTTSCCKSEGCHGDLRLRNVELVGNGGGGGTHFYCSGGCDSRNISLPCSEPYKDTKQSVISILLQIASGCNYGIYKTLLDSLGMHPVSNRDFVKTIELLFQPVTNLLDGQCALALKHKIGRWKRAVTEGDGARMTRGHYSQNFTYQMRDYTRNSLLCYIHLSQRGKDKICPNSLYEGTSKSCESYAARKCFEKLDIFLVTHWQDADSFSAKAVMEYFENCSIRLCGGNFARAHFVLYKNRNFQPQR